MTTIKSIILFIAQWVVLFGGTYLICKDARPDDGEALIRVLAIVGFFTIYRYVLRWSLEMGGWKIEEETEEDE